MPSTPNLPLLHLLPQIVSAPHPHPIATQHHVCTKSSRLTYAFISELSLLAKHRDPSTSILEAHIFFFSVPHRMNIKNTCGPKGICVCECVFMCNGKSNWHGSFEWQRLNYFCTSILYTCHLWQPLGSAQTIKAKYVVSRYKSVPVNITNLHDQVTQLRFFTFKELKSWLLPFQTEALNSEHIKNLTFFFKNTSQIFRVVVILLFLG